jgi:hypothetical protein
MGFLLGTELRPALFGLASTNLSMALPLPLHMVPKQEHGAGAAARSQRLNELDQLCIKTRRSLSKGHKSSVLPLLAYSASDASSRSPEWVGSRNKPPQHLGLAI